MKLNLYVTSYKGAPPGKPLSISLDQQSATIGRLKNNTLFLPDAMRYLSGHHAKIDYREPDYYIVDTSTNGVFINHSATALGNGNSAKLHDKDVITIGDYEIAVAISDESPLSPEQPVHETTADYDSLESEALEFPEDPFAELEADAVKKMIDANELIPDDWKSDQEKKPDLFDLPAAEANHAQREEFDHVPAHQQAFEPVHKQTESTEDIQEADSEESRTPDSREIFAEDWYIKDKYHGDETTGSEPPAKAPPVAAAQTDKKAAPPEVEAEAETEAEAVDISESPPDKQFHDDLIKSFLSGANLQDERLAEALTADTFHMIGVILNAAIQGTMEVLASRAKIKSEMHLDVTMIRPIQNNPIKFSVTAEEALTKLLLHHEKAYLPAEEAVDEAFNDIRAHQFSVISGMQTALIAILQRFDPEKLEQRLQQQNPISASIPIRKQAKLWDLFEQLYEEIKHEAEDDFYHLFGQAFAESYERQINKLKAVKDEIPID